MNNEPRPTTIYTGQNIDQYQRDYAIACYAQLAALSFGACFVCLAELTVNAQRSKDFYQANTSTYCHEA